MEKKAAYGGVLHNVSKFFVGANKLLVRVVDKLDLAIPTGTVFGLLAPNGAGKSVILRMLGGQIEPTTGSIALQGFDLAHQRQQALDGVTLALPRLLVGNGQRSVRSLLLEAGRRRGREPSDVRIYLGQYLPLSPLWEHREQQADELSDGLFQTLLLACALLQDPKVLLLDEPLCRLDADARTLLVHSLKNLAHTRGTTVVLATADPAAAQQLCDNVAVLRGGKLLAAGSVNELITLQDQGRFELRVGSLLDPQWQDWFEGLSMSWDSTTTLLSGSVIDQAALYGVLSYLRDMNVPLISVQYLPADLRAAYNAILASSSPR